jgi:hypothetical protein
VNNNGRPPEPPDIREYHENRCNFPLADLIPYAGKYVAWSPDGKRILASGDDMEEVERKLQAAGIHPSQVVGDYIEALEG